MAAVAVTMSMSATRGRRTGARGQQQQQHQEACDRLFAHVLNAPLLDVATSRPPPLCWVDVTRRKWLPVMRADFAPDHHCAYSGIASPGRRVDQRQREAH
jgi:hypothetical protein